MHQTIVLGLNAVWQKNADVECLTPGQVVRILKMSCFASGKGGNVAVALSVLRQPELHLVQCLGGRTGQKIARDLSRFSLTQHVIDIQAETRCCTTLMEASGRVSELIEPSPILSEEEWNNVAQKMEQILGTKESTILVSGSLPGGADGPLFEVLAHRKKQQKLWVDSVDPRWLALKPEVVKINAFEACTLAQVADFRVAGAQLMKQFGLFNLVITNQSENGWANCEGETLTYTAPPVAVVRNSTGAGDTFFAGCFYARRLQHSWASALHFAAGLAALRCQFDRIEELPYLPRSTP